MAEKISKTNETDDKKLLIEAQKKIYAKRLDQMEKKYAITSQESYIPNKLSSGFLCLDFIMAGGIAGGKMYQFSGLERGAKCLISQTIVNFNAGFLDLGEALKHCPKGWHRQEDVTVQTHKGEQKVSHFYKAKSKTIKIVTHSGFEIEGTPDHPMLVFTSALKYVWKKLSNINEEDWIVTNSTIQEPLFGATKISKELATIMGYLTANGQFCRLSSKDPKVISNFELAVEKETGRKPTVVKNRDCHNYDIKGDNEGKPWNQRRSFYNEILIPLGYSGSHSRKKSIPISIRTAPKPILHEFLESYFECDSGIGKSNQIRLITASKKLARQLHCILFQAYGILSRKSKIYSCAANSKKPKVRSYYELLMVNNDIELFLKTFKRAKVQKHSEILLNKVKANSSNLRCVPYVRAATKEAYLLAKTSRTKGHSTVKTIDGKIVNNFWTPLYIQPGASGANNNHYATDYHFYNTDWDKFIPHLSRISPELAKKLDIIRKSGYKYERVVSIKYSDKIKTVYDITVPETKSFIANCLVSHNTTGAYHIVGQAARKGIPIIEHWDVENAVSDVDYVKACSGFSTQQLYVGTKEEPKKVRLYQEGVLETFYNSTKFIMSSLPDKVYRQDAKQWFHVFDADQAGRANMGDFDYKKYNKTMFQETGRLWCECPVAGMQGFIVLDSYPALVVSRIEEDEQAKILPAMNAKAFADNIKKVIGIMSVKGFSILGINQIRTNPMPAYGQNPEYEPGGMSLAFYSSCRNQNRPRGCPPEMWEGVNGKGNKTKSFGQEPSVYGKGYDRYNYIDITNTKNRLGTPGLFAPMRTWFRDGHGAAHGYDIAYDIFQYLNMTGRIDGSPKRGLTVIHSEFKNLKIGKLTWDEFKLLVLSHTDPILMKRAKEHFKSLKKIPDIRPALFKEIRTKEAYKMLDEGVIKNTEDMEA